MYRTIFFLVMFAAVTAVAQEAPGAAEPDSAQIQQETAEQQVERDVAPDIIESTEEVSEDYSIDFPVDI